VRVTTEERSAAPVTTGNGIGIGGFVCGLVGLLLGWLIPLVGVVLGILGVTLGGVGTSRARRQGSGAGLAIAGVVLGALALIVSIIVWVAVAHALLSR
jgi:hypothetical protein